MYQYTDFDRRFVQERAAQYRDQLTRRLNGQLSEEEFRPLRLQNGWYVQRYAPMLRVAVPYGELNSAQLRVLARIAVNLTALMKPCFKQRKPSKTRLVAYPHRL
jgi:sulfite reductase (NADPH) hemoprotein beta-component